LSFPPRSLLPLSPLFLPNPPPNLRVVVVSFAFSTTTTPLLLLLLLLLSTATRRRLSWSFFLERVQGELHLLLSLVCFC
jgi:hypothetical protein